MSVLAADGSLLASDAHPRCPACDAPLAGDERFCISCGLRLAPDELRLAALPLLAVPVVPAGPIAAAVGGAGFPRPVVRSAAITAVVVLALGIAIGATIGPAAVGETAAAQRPVILVSAPAPAPAAAAADAASSSDDGSDGVTDDVQTLADAGADTSEPATEPPAAETPASSPPPSDDGSGGGSDDDEPATPAAPPPGSQALAGVVATMAADGESFVLVARDGRPLHVHASGCGVAPGDDLHLRARQLANGTWAADRVRRVASDDTLRVAGTVVWSDPASGRYALGARGVTLFVTVPPAAAPPAPAPTDPQAPAPAPPTAAPPASTDPQAPAPAPPAPVPPAAPALGAPLRVRLQAVPAHDGQPAALVEQVRHDAPPPADPAAPAPPLELAGLVQSVDPQARTLLLTLDADAQPPLTLTLSVPPAIDLGRLLPAERIAVTAAAQTDGTLALSGVSPDGDVLTADDATAFEGDQAPSSPPSGDDSPTTTAATCTILTQAASTTPPHA